LLSDARARDRLVLGGLMLLGTVLRLPTLPRAYWIDEGISIGIAAHPLGRIPGLLSIDGSPPLYYMLLHGWLRVFGSSEVSTHTMTLLLSVACVPLAWWSGRELFGRPAAVCAAALAATSPFLSWYATETRMYSLVACLALVAVTLAVRGMRNSSARDGVAALVAFALLLYTHDWALYLVVATGVVLAARSLMRRNRTELMWTVCGAGALVVVYLPWLTTFVGQARHTAAPWAVPPALGHFFADPALMFGGTAAVVVGPTLGLGVLIAWARSSSLRGSPVGSPAVVLAGIGGLVVVQGWLAAQLDPSWASRYLTVAFPALLLAVAGILAVSRPGRYLIAATAVLVTAWGLVGAFLPNPNARYAKSNVAAVTGAVRTLLQPGDLVLVTQTEQLAVVRHYLPAGLTFATPLGVVADPTVVDWRNLIRRLQVAEPCATLGPVLAALPNGAQVLVVNPYEPLGAPGTDWSVAVNRQVSGVNDLLSNSPSLSLIASFSPRVDHPEPFSPVTGLLFVKTGPRTACA
jgi:mannosyltransferase